MWLFLYPFLLNIYGFIVDTSSVDGRQPVATPPDSPSWAIGGAKAGGDSVSNLDVISEDIEVVRPRSYTAPSTFHCILFP